MKCLPSDLFLSSKGSSLLYGAGLFEALLSSSKRILVLCNSIFSSSILSRSIFWRSLSNLMSSFFSLSIFSLSMRSFSLSLSSLTASERCLRSISLCRILSSCLRRDSSLRRRSFSLSLCRSRVSYYKGDNWFVIVKLDKKKFSGDTNPYRITVEINESLKIK